MINLYKNISEEILKILQANDLDDVKLVSEFKKRQDLIDSLNEKELEEFRKFYNEEGVCNIDKTIKGKLAKEIINTKKEINNFKVNRIGNSVYANMNKNNLNIFYKKV